MRTVCYKIIDIKLKLVIAATNKAKALLNLGYEKGEKYVQKLRF